MAFRNGDESDELLQCRKCNGAYPMDANFCGFCRAPRNIALGIEKGPEFANVNKQQKIEPTRSTKSAAPVGSFKADTKAALRAEPVVPAPPKKKMSSESKKKIRFIIIAIMVLVIAVFSIIKISTRHIQSAGEVTVDGPCVITDMAVEHFVNLKNLIDNIPVGSNEGENKKIILDWATEAESVSRQLKLDENDSTGTIKTNLYNTVQDLNVLVSLTRQWANKNYTNPDSFVTDYTSASDKVRENYKDVSTACGDRVPKA
jgi:hypothetical protein